MKVIRTLAIDDLSPEELAFLFCEMDGEQQAVFFTRVGDIAKGWPGAGWCQQASAIAKHLSPLGTETVLKLAEWASDPEGLKA